MLWCCMLAALGEAVVDGLQANGMTLLAVVDALVYGWIAVFSGMVSSSLFCRYTNFFAGTQALKMRRETLKISQMRIISMFFVSKGG